MRRLGSGVRLVLLGSMLTGCPAGPSDPPPPPSKLEIPQAPPRALGALAAGTDAAPRPERAFGEEGGPSLPRVPPQHRKVPAAGVGGGGSAPEAEPSEPPLEPGVAL